MSSSVEKIKEIISIVDIVSSYIKVEQSGKNYKAKCPFHNEKTASFYISNDRGNYYCFGCGEKGDIFSFVQKFEGTDFMGALKLLALKAGVTLDYKNNDSNDKKNELYYDILEDATTFFENNLDKNKEALEYLSKRGITKEYIKLFRIGYALDEWKSVYNYLLDKNYKTLDIETVGLIKKSSNFENNNNLSTDNITNYYDRFRSRIIFPINNSSGRVIAYSGRIFNKEEVDQAKYLNSPDTPLFNKSNVFFGIDKAKESIRKRNYSIIVEGQMDLILSHKAGFTNTVAVSGTAFTDNIKDSESKINNLGLIRRLSPNIIFAYDGDDAGLRAINRSAIIALSLDMQVKIVDLPNKKDPADIINENMDEWKKLVKNSEDIIDFLTKKIIKNTSNLDKRGKEIKEKIFPLLTEINSSIKKSSYVSLISSMTGIGETAILEDLNEFEKKYKNSKLNNSIDNNIIINEKFTRRDSLERRLFGLLFSNDTSLVGVDKESIIESLIDKLGNDLYEKIRDKHKINQEHLTMEVEMWYGDKIKSLQSDINEIILSLEEEIINENLLILRDKINNNLESSDELLVDYQKKVERIQKIKSQR